MIRDYEFEEWCREKNAADGHDGYMDDDDNKVLTLEDIEKMKRDVEIKEKANMGEAAKKSYTIRGEFPVQGEDSVEGYRYIKAKTGADIREEARKEAEEQNDDEHEEEGDETNMTCYETIYDYVQDADLSYYETSDGELRETPFVEGVEPAEDPDFVISSDAVGHEGKWYRKVNFGENEESWLLESALYETVFLVYVESSYGHYVSTGRVYETEEEAKASI